MTSQDTDSLGLLIHDAARLMRRRFEERAVTYGLSSAQFRLLVRLVKDEGAPQARLAEFLEIEPISVSRLLDRMEEGGWIERRPDASDRRVRMVFPTAKSRETYGAIKSMAGEVYDEALAGLSAETREIVMAGLRTIRSNLAAADEKVGTVSENSPEVADR